MNLVIVESPNKIKKIQGILDKVGGSWRVEASAGHIRDLPEKDMGVAPPNFIPQYEIIPDKQVGNKVYSKKDTVDRLIARAKSATTVYLATDPDREGDPSLGIFSRRESEKSVTHHFHEITTKAVTDAVKMLARLMAS